MTDEELKALVTQIAVKVDANADAIAGLQATLAAEREQRLAGEDLLTLDMSGFRQDMVRMRRDMQGLRGEISDLNSTVSSLRQDVLTLWGRQGGPD